MSESLGAAYVSVSLDSAEMEAKVERAKGKLAGLGADAQSAFNAANVGGKAATLSFAKYAETIGLSRDQVKYLYAALRGAPTTALAAVQKNIDATRDSLERATQAANKAAGDTKFIEGLKAQSEAINKTRADLLEMEAAKRGKSAEAAPYIAKLREQEGAYKGLTKEVNAYGLSQKQQVAAMRQVPAQMTDIFVSLQGGQKPLTVLIQQGGQLKDVFGGIKPAATALYGAVSSLITPWTLLAAAVVAVGVVVLKAQGRFEDFAITAAKSGNIAGSAKDLQSFADAMGEIDSVTRGAADESVNKLAATGRLAGENFRLAAESSARWAAITGDSVDSVVAKYVQIARDPLDGLTRLSEAENFLTIEQYRRVKALQDVGDIQGAVTEATKIYHDVLESRSSEALAQMGLYKSLLLEVKDQGSSTFSSISDWLGTVEAQLSKQILKYRSLIGVMTPFSATARLVYGGYVKDVQDASDALATAGVNNGFAASARAMTQQQLADARKLDAIRTELASKDEKRDRAKAELERLISNGTVTDLREINRLRAAHEEKYKDKADKKPKSTATADLRADLQSYKDAMAAEQANIANGTRLVQAQYSARLVDAKTYYTKMRELAQRSAASEESGITGQIAELKARNATGTEAINISRQIASLESKLGQVRAKLGVDTTLLEIAENQLNESREFAKKAYRDALEAETSAMERSYQAQYAKVTMSDREYEKSMKLVDIEQRLADKRRDLANQLARDGGANNAEAQQQFEENTKLAIDAARKQKDGVATYYTQMATLESNWRNGMTTGLQNWKDRAADVAGQVASLTTSLLNSTVNTLTTFANTGKFAFKEMLADMLRQMAAFMMNQAVLNFLKAFAGDGKGGDGKQGFWGSLISAAIGGLTKNATGDTYKSQSLSGYSNGVYNSPQPFMFAKGAGVFGEAGWEAIMPLTRGPDGNLGVRTTGGGGAAASGGVSVNIVLNSDGSSTKQTQGAEQSDLRKLGGEIGTIVEERLQRHMMPGGLLWKAGVGVGA